MTTKERAGKWLWDNGLAGSRSVWAHEKDRDALAALLDEVRAEAVEEPPASSTRPTSSTSTPSPSRGACETSRGNPSARPHEHQAGLDDRAFVSRASRSRVRVRAEGVSACAPGIARHRIGGDSIPSATYQTTARDCKSAGPCSLDARIEHVSCPWYVSWAWYSASVATVLATVVLPRSGVLHVRRNTPISGNTSVGAGSVGEAGPVLLGLMYYRHTGIKRPGMYNDTDGRAIPVTKLQDRRLYRVDTRNLGPVALCYVDGNGDGPPWSHTGFIGIRTKFKARFLDTEYHYQGTDFPTAVPWALLPDELPADIAADEHYPPYPSCRHCGVRTKWDSDRVAEVHTGETSCQNPAGVYRQNDALYAWLQTMEVKYAPPHDPENL